MSHFSRRPAPTAASATATGSRQNCLNMTETSRWLFLRNVLPRRRPSPRPSRASFRPCLPSACGCCWPSACGGRNRAAGAPANQSSAAAVAEPAKSSLGGYSLLERTSEAGKGWVLPTSERGPGRLLDIAAVLGSGGTADSVLRQQRHQQPYAGTPAQSLASPGLQTAHRPSPQPYLISTPSR